MGKESDFQWMSDNGHNHNTYKWHGRNEWTRPEKELTIEERVKNIIRMKDIIEKDFDAWMELTDSYKKQWHELKEIIGDKEFRKLQTKHGLYKNIPSPPIEEESEIDVIKISISKEEVKQLFLEEWEYKLSFEKRTCLKERKEFNPDDIKILLNYYGDYRKFSYNDIISDPMVFEVALIEFYYSRSETEVINGEDVSYTCEELEDEIKKIGDKVINWRW